MDVTSARFLVNSVITAWLASIDLQMIVKGQIYKLKY